MKHDDLLKRATDALRAEGDRPAEVAPFTERRILATLERQRRAQRKRIVWVLPVAAAFVASAAWATATGRTMQFVRAAASVFHGDDAVVATAPTAPGGAVAVRPQGESIAAPASLAATETPPSLPVLPPPDTAPPVTAAPAAVAAPRGAKPSLPSPPIAVAPPIVEAPITSAVPATSAAPIAAPTADELYREAHRLHFETKDYRGAADAWDRYLAVAPNGALAPEARFNRAICLVRLGRIDEARAALRTFANGTYGPYRQAEAQRLLDALKGP